MYADGDLRYYLANGDRSALWPIDVFLSAKTSRGKQPTGEISIEVPRGAWWVDASGMLAVPSGPGVGYHLETYFRSYVTPLQIATIQESDIRYDSQKDTLSITAEAFWSWAQRARLIWGPTEQVDYDTINYTDHADDIARQVWRDNMVAGGHVPNGYPLANRTDFNGLTVAVQADAHAHATQPKWDVDCGRNVLEAELEIADKWDLRHDWTLSGSTFTYTTTTPYTGTSKVFSATGKMLSDSFGCYTSLGLGYDMSSVRNVWLVRDGTNRLWTSDGTSVAAYGILEDVMKITTAGAATSVDMRIYEAAHQLQDKDLMQSVTLDLAPGPAWIAAVTDYGIANTVTVQNAALGTDSPWDIVGLEIDDGPDGPKVKLVINDHQRNYFQEAWRRPGPRGGFGAGSRWWDLSG